MIKVTKNVFQMKTSACLKDKSWERYHNTFTPSLHLMPLCQLCFVFVSCVPRRVVEGSGEGSGGCVVHVDVDGECVTLWVAAM